MPVPGAPQSQSHKWQRHPLATPTHVLCQQGMLTSGSDVLSVGARQAAWVEVGRIIVHRGHTVLGETGALVVREDTAVIAQRAAGHTQAFLGGIRYAHRDLAWVGRILVSCEDM